MRLMGRKRRACRGAKAGAAGAASLGPEHGAAPARLSGSRAPLLLRAETPRRPAPRAESEPLPLSLRAGQKDNRPTDRFQLTFPLRTNYMYAKVKRSLPEMYAFSVSMWIKSNASPGVGTPFSYAVPGQANELVLIEWGNNPMEILINDKVGWTPSPRRAPGSPLRPPRLGSPPLPLHC